MATLNVNVNPTGAVSGAAVAGSALDKLKAKALSLETSMNGVGKVASRLGIAFSALAAATAVGPILRASDAYTVISNRLRLVTASQEELATAYKAVYKLAQETRAPLEATGKFYAQLSLNAKQLKLSQEDLITVTGTLNKIIALTGQSAEASSNAIIQLQQALGSGQLRGDELRSIMEQLPLLGQIIADSMGIAYGQLKDAGAAGEITAQIVTQALKASAEDIDKAFKNMTFTFGQAFIMLYNGFVNAIGQINEATSLFSALAKGIAYAGYYMTEIIQVTGLFAAALITVKAAGFVTYLQSMTWVVTGVTGAFTRNIVVTTVWHAAMLRLSMSFAAAKAAMVSFMLSNPFTALLTGLVLVLPLLYQFRDSIVLSRDGTVTLGTVFASAFATLQAILPVVLEALRSLGQTVMDIGSAVVTAFIPIWKAVQTVFDALYPSIEAIAGAFGGTATKVATLTGAIGFLLLRINPWIGAALLVVGVLNQIDPGLAKTTFALTLMGEAIGVLINLALVPLVVAFQTVVNIMGAFGFVTADVVKNVNQQSDAFIKNAGDLSGMTERVQEAYDAMVEQEEATAKSGKTSSAWSTILGDQLNPALDKTATSSDKTAKSSQVLADSVDNINRSLHTTPEAVKKVDNAFERNIGAANANKIAIDNLTAALKKLETQQNKMGNGGTGVTISGGIDEVGKRAKGGPVKANTPYLVGERGPELFTPNSAGNITKNSDLAAMSSFASNDNNAPRRLEPSAASEAVVKQVVRIGNSVVESNEQVIAMTKKWTMVNYKDSSYAEVKKYEGDMSAETRAANGGNVVKYGGRTVAGGDYTRKDGTKPIFGDEDYVSDLQWATRTSLGLSNRGVSSTGYDANKPGDLAVAAATNAVALGGSASLLEEALKNQEAMIQRMKDIRDNTAAFKAFKASYQQGMGTPTTIDFQTLFPNGTPAFTGNPYKVGDASPSMLNLTPPQSKKNKSAAESSDKPTQISMVVVTPNAESFRRNRAQVEGEVYGMVKRAQRRAG